MKQQFTNFGWLGGERVFRLAAGFVVTILLARYLGADQFGAYGYILGLVAVFAPLALTSLDQAVTQKIVEDRAKARQLLTTVLALRVPGAILAVAACIVTMSVLPNPEGTSVELVAIALLSVLALPFQSLSVFFNAIERPKLIVTAGVIVTLIATFIILICIASRQPMAAFILVRSGEALALGAAAVILFLVVTRGTGALRFDADLFRYFLKSSFPLLLASIASAIYMRIDQVMLGQMADLTELGSYTVAVRISDSALFIPMAIQAAFFPAVVRAYQTQDQARFAASLKSLFGFMIAAMSLAAIGVTAFGALVTELFLGPSYNDAIPMIALLALALPSVGLGVARTGYLTLHGWFWTAPLGTATGAVLNIGLNLLLIPPFGGVGAAVATLVSYFVAGVGTCFLFPWLREAGWIMIASANPLYLLRRSIDLWNGLRSAEA